MAQPQRRMEQVARGGRASYLRLMPHRRAKRRKPSRGRINIRILFIRSRKLVREFCSVQVIDDIAKRQLLPRIRRHVVRVEAFDIRARRILANTFFPLALLFFGMALLIPTLFRPASPSDSSVNIVNMLQVSSTAGKETFFGLAGTAGVICVIILPPVLIPLYIRRYRRQRKPKSAVSVILRTFLPLVPILAVGEILFLATNEETHILGRAMLRGVLAALVYFGLSFVFVAIAYTVRRHLTTTRIPDSIIVTELLHILRIASGPPVAWASLRIRREIIARLETVALCVQYGLPRQLGGSDVVTNLWIKEQTHEMASAFRSLKRWVASPRSDTQEQFTKRIAVSLVHYARGEWDLLERLSPGNLSRPLRRAQVLSAVKTVIVGVVPLLGLFAVQHSSLRIEGGAADYLKVGAFLWAALTYISLLDPTYNVKLTALKEIMSILPLKQQDDQK
jgi:hypothetical protein